MKIGNVDMGIDVEKANAINNVGKSTDKECKNCWAIVHCSMCGAASDDMNEFSRDKRMEGYDSAKNNAEYSLMTVCFLTSHGYDFERNIIR